MTATAFAAALKMHRERLQLTQTEAAQILGGCPLRSYQRYEAGDRTLAAHWMRLALDRLAAQRVKI